MADYKIKLETEADTTGAKKAVEGLKDVEQQATITGKSMDGPASAVDALDEEIDKLVQQLLDAKPATEEFKSAQEALANALAKTEAKASQAMAPLGEADLAIKKVGGSSRNNGMAVLEFSRAFEDAQYGIRGVLNNIPGLLSALGAGAGLAGALSLVAVVGSQVLGPALDALDEKFDISGEKAKAAAEKTAAYAEKIRAATLAAEEAKIKEYQESLDNLAEAQGKVNEQMQSEIELQATLRQARDATARSQNELQQATIKAAGAMGLISPEEAATKMAALAAAQNEANADAAIAAQKDVEAKAAAAKEWQDYQITFAQSQKAAIEQDLKRDEQRYLELQEKLRKAGDAVQSAEAAAMEKFNAQNTPDSNGGIPGSVARMLLTKPELPLAEQAALEGVKNQMAAMELRMNAKMKILDDADRKISDAERAAEAAGRQLENTQKAVQAKIEEITSIASDQTTKDQLQSLVEKTQESRQKAAADIQKAIDDVEPQTQRQTEALDILKKALADGEITASESKDVAKAIADMTGNINGNIKELIDVALKVQQVQATHSAQIRQIKDNQDVLLRNTSQQLSTE